MDNPNNRLISKEDVENILNYFENIGDDNTILRINNLEHYQEAFVHESYYQAIQNSLTNGEHKTIKNFYIPKSSSERLEYLGDSILKAIMGRYLFERFSNEREGFLTKLKIKIEKCSMLHKIGVTLGFKKYLLLSLQVENQSILDINRGRSTPSFYEDSFEAFIGSILVDFGEKGYLYADRFVRSVIENIIDFSELIAYNDNFKDSVQRFFQQQLNRQIPQYISLQEDGPLYRKIFTRMLVVSEQQFLQLSEIVQNDIKKYNHIVLEEYRLKNPQVFQKLFNICSEDKFILGVGFGRKVTEAEQSCAKICLENLHLDLNF